MICVTRPSRATIRPEYRERYKLGPNVRLVEFDREREARIRAHTQRVQAEMARGAEGQK